MFESLFRETGVSSSDLLVMNIFVDVFCTLVDHLECDATASSSLSVRNEPEEERKRPRRTSALMQRFEQSIIGRCVT